MEGVENELLQIAYLTPLMFASMSPPVFDKVICTDASSVGGAMVATKFPTSFFDLYHHLILDMDSEGGRSSVLST